MADTCVLPADYILVNAGVLFISTNYSVDLAGSEAGSFNSLLTQSSTLVCLQADVASLKTYK